MQTTSHTCEGQQVEVDFSVSKVDARGGPKHRLWFSFSFGDLRILPNSEEESLLPAPVASAAPYSSASSSFSSSSLSGSVSASEAADLQEALLRSRLPPSPQPLSLPPVLGPDIFVDIHRKDGKWVEARIKNVMKDPNTGEIKRLWLHFHPWLSWVLNASNKCDEVLDIPACLQRIAEFHKFSSGSQTDKVVVGETVHCYAKVSGHQGRWFRAVVVSIDGKQIECRCCHPQLPSLLLFPKTISLFFVLLLRFPLLYNNTNTNTQI